MPCTQQTFLGASIKSYNGNIGWNTQTGSITVSVVNDPDNGDSFNPPIVGAPVFFKLQQEDVDFEFTFGGLLQSWDQVKDQNNFPAYEVVVNDPREILEDIHLIIGGYHQTVNLPNLFNVYGHLESIAFGGANVNDGGMAWNSIMGSLIALGTGPTLWSGGINVQGYTYNLDLTEVPIVPIYFRIPGQNVTLLSAIDLVCREAGYDYYIDLVEGENDIHTIRVRTVSRRMQPNIGAIDRFVNENCLTVTGLRKGQEFRNETTTAFLVGPQKETLYEVTAATDAGIDLVENEFIWPYWGVNELGHAIISDIDYRDTDDTKTVTVDARALNVAGVGYYYTMSLGEIRSALSGFDAWASYVEAIDPAKAALLGLKPIWGDLRLPVLRKVLDGKATAADFIDFKKEVAVQRAKRLVDEITLKSQQNIFQFVSNYAHEFYGRKFMVRIPDILGYYEPETGRGITSLEPTDSGWPQDVAGENIINNLGPFKPFFTNEQGKLQCFVRFDNLISEEDLKSGRVNVDILNGHDQNNLVKWGDYIFIRCTIDQKLVYRNVYTLDSPRAVITLSAPLLHRFEDDGFPAHMRGILKVLEKMINLTYTFEGTQRVKDTDTGQIYNTAKDFINDKRDNILKSLRRMPGGQLFTGLAERPYLPDKALIPLKSNIITYGPWYFIGSPGKVDFERDESLNPWTYGGILLLDTVARAKIRDKITNMTRGETGTITFVGAPRHNVGDYLIEGGPNLTGITSQISDQGTLTTYRFRTFTPKFGVANKAYIDRLQRVVRRFQEYDRDFRQQQFISRGGDASFFRYRRDYILNENGPIGVKKGTPHEFVAASTITIDPTEDIDYITTNVAAAFMTGPEALVGTNADDEEYSMTSIMNAAGLFRGFSTDPSRDDIPHFENPKGQGSGSHPHIHDLNPFSGSENSENIDIGYIASDDEYPEEGIATDSEDYVAHKARPIGFRGPIIIAGWGYNQYGQPLPSSSISASQFLDDYKQRSNKWPTGPVDLRWDEYRNVWGGYVVHTARANGIMTRGGSGNFDIYTGNPGNNMFRTGRNVWACDWMLASGQTITSGQKCVLGYNGWNHIVLAAECTVTSGSVLFPGG